MFAVSFPEKQISEFDGNTLNAHAGFSPEKFWTGFRTHEQVTRELGGGDWEDNVAELAHENEQLKAAGSEGVIETTESVTTQGGKENAESTE